MQQVARTEEKHVWIGVPHRRTHPSRKLSDLIFAISPSPMSSQEASRGRAVCASMCRRRFTHHTLSEDSIKSMQMDTSPIRYIEGLPAAPLNPPNLLPSDTYTGGITSTYAYAHSPA